MRSSRRYLAFYLAQKFSRIMKDISEDEMIIFLNQTGWELYDSQTMIDKFQAWRDRRTITAYAAVRSA